MFSREDAIIVTGASSGIGQGIAIKCARKGATVIAVGRAQDRLRVTAEAVPGQIHVAPFDLLDLEGIEAFVKSLAERHGKMTGLVCAAGDGIMDILRTYDPTHSEKYFRLNFSAPLLLARAFANKRISGDGGSIVFLGSVAGLFPEKGHLTYGAAKAALMAAAKSMSQELAPRLRVNCIAPGIVDTPLEAKAEAAMGKEYRARMLAGYPLGFGKPEDVAHMAAFLLSGEARWITGQNFILDGGRY